jgi:hypothetical protein
MELQDLRLHAGGQGAARSEADACKAKTCQHENEGVEIAIRPGESEGKKVEVGRASPGEKGRRRVLKNGSVCVKQHSNE